MVTSYDAETGAIFGRIEDNWVLTDVAWPNTSYEPGEAAYIEPRITRGQAFNASVAAASKLVRHPGLLVVQVRAPLNQGDRPALELADALAEVFRNVTFSGITFRAPTVRDFGRDGKWHRCEMAVAFHRDSIFND